MARSRHNSPLVRVAWTDAVSGNRRSSLDPEEPIELRFGLSFEPSFWTSFQSSIYFASWTVYRYGAYVRRFDLSGETHLLAGAPSAQLWIGLHLGRASQAAMFYSGPVPWTAVTEFKRFGGPGNGVTQWAATPDQSAFMIEQFPAGDDGFDFQRQTGGPGTPLGTPPGTAFT